MSMMKELARAVDSFERWTVLRVVSPHSPTSTHRLMENVGGGRWVQRAIGTRRAMLEQANRYNKEDYQTESQSQMMVAFQSAGMLKD